MQDLIIGQIGLCMMVGCALSFVTAAALLQPIRLCLSSILSRLLLAGGPVYLCVDYLLRQDRAMVAVAGTIFALGLYCLRGWWLPEHLFAVDFAAAFLRVTGRTGRAAASSRAILEHRIHSVVRADRRLAQLARPN